MNLRSHLRRCAIALCGRRAARPAAVAGAALAAALLAACGDSEVVEPFRPDRVVAFGDEASVILADGRKYTINDFTDSAVDCIKNPIWVQQLATELGKPMAACPGTSTTATSVSRAEEGATVATVTAQIDAHLAADTLGDKDLVTLAVGLHDIVAAYTSAVNDGESAATAQLTERGKALGQQVNRIALGGTPVLVLTVPDVGRTPFGAAEEAANAGRAALMARLTSNFNTSMRLEIINDGRIIGLVDAFDLFGAFIKFQGNYGLANTTTPACLAANPVPSCTSQTLLQVNGAAVSQTAHLWADSLHYGPTAHRYVAIIAAGRARNNPF